MSTTIIEGIVYNATRNHTRKGGSTVKKLQTALVTIFALFLFIPVAQANTLNDIKFFVETYYYGDIPKNLQT